MKQKRIYQIAKELNISHVEIIKFLKNKDIEVKNHMMPVDEQIYDLLMLEFSKEKKIVERQLKEKARKAIVENKDSQEENIITSDVFEEQIGVVVNADCEYNFECFHHIYV